MATSGRHQGNVMATSGRHQGDVRATSAQHQGDVRATSARHPSDVRATSRRRQRDVSATSRRRQGDTKATSARHQGDVSATPRRRQRDINQGEMSTVQGRTTTTGSSVTVEIQRYSHCCRWQILEDHSIHTDFPVHFQEHHHSLQTFSGPLIYNSANSPDSH